MKAVFVVAVAVLASCEVGYEPDVGPLANTSTSNEVTLACSDSDPATAVSFEADIRPLTTRSPGGCLFCHGAATTSGFNLGSYASLRRGGINSGSDVIVPGSPCESILVDKLGPTPPFGSRMPFNGPPYFTAAEIQLVSDWIAEGALDN